MIHQQNLVHECCSHVLELGILVIGSGQIRRYIKKINPGWCTHVLELGIGLGFRRFIKKILFINVARMYWNWVNWVFSDNFSAEN